MLTISIIVPVYQVEPYVVRCLKSVMEQACDEADIECIVVDDCGSDGSMELVRQLLAAYDGPVRFVPVAHEKNRGLSAARNTGVAKATGEYVMFVDSDDYLLAGSISYFARQQAQHPEADLLAGNVKNMKNGALLMPGLTEPELLADRNVFFQRMLRHQIYLYAWNKLIRRSLLDGDNGVRFIEGILYEDQSWSFELFTRLSTVLLLPRTTYVYDYNQQSIVNTTFSEGKASLVLKSYTVSTCYMLDNPPDGRAFRINIAADYLLFMAGFLMNGVDVCSQQSVTARAAQDFHAVKLRLLRRSLRYGRLLVAVFLLLLFRPLSYVQKWRTFRHHYHELEAGVNRLAHLADILHRRHRL